MPKFISTVRFVTKDGCADEFIRKHHETDFKNIAVSQQLIRTSDKEFVGSEFLNPRSHWLPLGRN